MYILVFIYILRASTYGVGDRLFIPLFILVIGLSGISPKCYVGIPIRHIHICGLMGIKEVERLVWGVVKFIKPLGYMVIISRVWDKHLRIASSYSS